MTTRCNVEYGAGIKEQKNPKSFAMTHLYKKNAASARRLVFTTILILSGLAQLPGQLSGTYTIGGFKPDYSTINAAVSDLNWQGISGPVTFMIRPGYYTEQVTLRKVRGTSMSRVITFQSESRNAGDTRIQFYPEADDNNYVVRFDGAYNYKIKNITLENLSASRGRVVHVINTAENLQIESCRLYAAHFVSTYDEQSILHFTPSGSRNIMIKNNSISGGGNGMFISGSNTGTHTGTVITGNSISRYYYMGVVVRNLQGGRFTNNKILGVSQVPDSPIALTIANWNGTPLSPVLVANNFVSVQYGNQWGFALSNSNHIQVFNNSINQATDQTVLSLSNVQNVAVLNNILRAGRGLAVRAYNAVNLNMNYNDLITRGQILGSWNWRSAYTFTKWQLLSGKDSRSLNVDPEFVADYDLHAKAVALIGAGVAIPNVTSDIDGESRSNPPCIGADEFKLAIKFPWWYPMYSAKSTEPNAAATGNDADAKQEGIGISVREHAVFPTPAFDRLNVAITDAYAGSVTLSVLDGLGRKVSEFSYEKDGPDLRTEITVSDLVPGVYLLRIEEGKEVTVKRFVKR